jgi:hypothetical protein
MWISRISNCIDVCAKEIVRALMCILSSMTSA